MRIARQHQWKDKDFVPTCAWPDDCLVQWGGHGVVIGNQNGPGYQTAFFEAFPEDNSGGFIRGEGPTIADAEASAFAKWRARVVCDHRWARKGYTNGGGFCRKCNAFRSVFHPIVTLGAWRAPLSDSELNLIGMGGLMPYAGDVNNPSGTRLQRRLALKAKAAGIDLPPVPTADQDHDDGEDYEDACTESVVKYFAEHIKRLRADAASGGVSGLFSGMTMARYERMARERGLL